MGFNKDSENIMIRGNSENKTKNSEHKTIKEYYRNYPWSITIALLFIAVLFVLKLLILLDNSTIQAFCIFFEEQRGGQAPSYRPALP
jgi:hypothetical protein